MIVGTLDHEVRGQRHLTHLMSNHLEVEGENPAEVLCCCWISHRSKGTKLFAVPLRYWVGEGGWLLFVSPSVLRLRANRLCKLSAGLKFCQRPGFLFFIS